MDHNNLYYQECKPLLKRAGLDGEGFTFHALRHTFATTLFAYGEHPKVVQSLLGHASITQMMDTYSLFMDGMVGFLSFRACDAIYVFLGKETLVQGTLLQFLVGLERLRHEHRTGRTIHRDDRPATNKDSWFKYPSTHPCPTDHFPGVVRVV